MADLHLLKMEDRLSMHLLACAVTMITPRWNAVRASDSFWRLYINNRDGAKVHTQRGDYHLTAGVIHFVPAWVTFTCLNTTDIEHFYIHFDVLGLPPTLIRKVFDRPMPLPLSPDRREALIGLKDALKARRMAPLSQLCSAKSLVYWAMGDLFAQLSTDQIQACDRAMVLQETVGPAIRRIDEAFGRPLKNSELAGLCYMSEDYFIRRFRECVGQTPAQYIQERRISEAAKLLCFGDQTIDQIADRTGFCNRYYFSRIFAKHFGMGPGAYRKRDYV